MLKLPQTAQCNVEEQHLYSESFTDCILKGNPDTLWRKTIWVLSISWLPPGACEGRNVKLNIFLNWFYNSHTYIKSPKWMISRPFISTSCYTLSCLQSSIPSSKCINRPSQTKWGHRGFGAGTLLLWLFLSSVFFYSEHAVSFVWCN